jgi:hypothetical protein
MCCRHDLLYVDGNHSLIRRSLYLSGEKCLLRVGFFQVNGLNGYFCLVRLKKCANYYLKDGLFNTTEDYQQLIDLIC